jgi:toxin ParE1/3/4
MTGIFRLTEPAIQDIEQIADYIARQSEYAQAERFLAKLDAKFAKITQFPMIGRQRNEVLPGLRSTPIYQYVKILIFSALSVAIETSQRCLAERINHHQLDILDRLRKTNHAISPFIRRIDRCNPVNG